MRDIFCHQRAVIIFLYQLFTNRQAATDYVFDVISRDEVNDEISCKVPLLCGHYSLRIVCGENTVISLRPIALMSKVEQEDCESAAETQNRAQRACGMDL